MKEQVSKIAENSIKDLVHAQGTGIHTLEVRTGEAKKLLPEQDTVKKSSEEFEEGQISNISDYIRKRAHLLNVDDCFIVVDREEGTMLFEAEFIEDFNKYSHRVKGKLELSKELINFRINQDFEMESNQWARFFRTKRRFFVDKQEHVDVVKSLSNFKANITKLREEKNDGRGNSGNLTLQEVEHNLPEKIDLKLKLVKGKPEKTIRVYFEVNSEDLSLSLFSEDVYEISEKIYMESIQEELDKKVSIKGTEMSICDHFFVNEK